MISAILATLPRPCAFNYPLIVCFTLLEAYNTKSFTKTCTTMNHRIHGIGISLLVAGLFLTSNLTAKNTANKDHEAWLTSIGAARAQEDNEFKNSPTSPLAGTLRFEISETGTVYFAENAGQLEWSLEPRDEAAFSVLNTEEQWQWTGLATGTSLMRQDKVLPSGSILDFGDLAKVGRFTVEFYPVKNTLTALVFDPDTQRIREFQTLERFEANPDFVLTATIERFEAPEQLELITGLQRLKKRYRYAKLHFEIDAKELELTAYKHALEGKGSNSLFIPFTDKTTGKYTYGGGRYLIVDEPAEGDEIEIDFNLVVNPLCSYAPIYNCIVPTRENKLPIAVLAGVRKYHE